jgi:hypothetical protein
MSLGFRILQVLVCLRAISCPSITYPSNVCDVARLAIERVLLIAFYAVGVASKVRRNMRVSGALKASVVRSFGPVAASGLE